jgi:uncharacterized membrane protein
MYRIDPPLMPGHDGFGWWPALLPLLSTLFWVALLVGLALVLLKWVLPHMLPTLAGIFGRPAEELSSLEILRRRFAAGEIEAGTFEQMRERLEASYQGGE